MLLGSWENEERPAPVANPAGGGEEDAVIDEDEDARKKVSAIYAMDVHSEAVWLAAGLQAHT